MLNSLTPDTNPEKNPSHAAPREHGIALCPLSPHSAQEDEKDSAAARPALPTERSAGSAAVTGRDAAVNRLEEMTMNAPHTPRATLTRTALASMALSGAACSPSSDAAPTAPPAAAANVAPALSQGNGVGNSPYQLTKAGWRCLNVPFHGIHCEDPHWDHNGVHVQVKVFDTADPTSRDAKFLGTESLIRSDRYAGQPCLPGHGEYFLIPAGPRAGYYACHHFDF
jgi:hypothetical protein